jgi:hypothetical protein
MRIGAEDVSKVNKQKENQRLDLQRFEELTRDAC